ncbi:MAG: hypothetical protein ONA90_00995 [candidate division KSB1 bacterium]|nr:hypothetical protein [candidate division KSB1 bacterium]
MKRQGADSAMFIPQRFIHPNHPAEKLAELFWRAHQHVRAAVRAALTERSPNEILHVAAQAQADTIYGIDAIAESEFLKFIEAHQYEAPAFLLVGEFESGDAIPFGKGQPQFRVLLDPIDGTRLLMYGKASGWILTGIAPEYGEATRLREIFFSLQTELPTPKYLYADTAWASPLGTTEGVRENLMTGEIAPLPFSPDPSEDLRHGFVSFVKLFPQGKQLLAGLEEEFLNKTLEGLTDAPALVFDDQHLSTGGQLFALMSGQLRMVVDLRPLLNMRWRREQKPASLCAHPYDLAAWLIAEKAGVVLYSMEGQAFDGPTHPTAEVGWMGFANPRLAHRYLPSLLRILKNYKS